MTSEGRKERWADFWDEVEREKRTKLIIMRLLLGIAFLTVLIFVFLLTFFVVYVF
jgi:hypothetical protein